MKDLVLIHGMFGHAGNWARLAPLLEQGGYRLHVPELPGHGARRGEGVAGLGIGEYTRSIRPLLAGIATPPVLLGHSMGALIAQKLATERPLAGLALLAPVPPRCVMPLDRRRLEICWLVFRQHGPRFGPFRMPRELADARLFAGWSADLADQAWRSMGEESSRVLFQMECWPLDWRGTNRVQTSRIHCPVFVAGAGREKILAPWAAKRTAGQYRATYRCYEDAGHMLILEPVVEQLAQDLLQWLNELS